MLLCGRPVSDTAAHIPGGFAHDMAKVISRWPLARFSRCTSTARQRRHPGRGLSGRTVDEVVQGFRDRTGDGLWRLISR